MNIKGGTNGFLAYTKINPFAAAAQGPGFSSQMSPKSPKNPFSTVSPKHNPFMSFVDKKEEYWDIMSTNPSLAKTSSIFGFNSDVVQNTMINSVSTKQEKDQEDNKNTDAEKSVFGSRKPSDIESTVEKEKDNMKVSASSSPSSDAASGAGSPLKPGNSDFFPNQSNDSYVVMNGEEGEECVFQIRAKLFRLVSKCAGASAPEGTTTTDKNDKGKDNEKKCDSNSQQKEAPTDVDSSNSEDKAESKQEKEEVSEGSAGETKVKAPTTEWVEVGTGPIRVLRPSKEKNPSDPDSASTTSTKSLCPRVVMRRECQPGGQGTKLILNELLREHTAVSKVGDKAVRLTVVSMHDEKAVPVSYLLKTKYATVCSVASV